MVNKWSRGDLGPFKHNFRLFCFMEILKLMSYMACMEDLLLQKGCLKAYATLCLCGFLKDRIYELVLFAFMYFSCVGLVF